MAKSNRSMKIAQKKRSRAAWAQTQRIELNGHLISQGFLPLVDGGDDAKGPQLSIVLSVENAECRIRDVMIQVPKERAEANDF